MPLWDRFTRMVKSNVGRLLDDPLEKSGAGKRLEQRMKELRARDGELKALDEQLITLKGHATFLERKLEKLKLKEAEHEARLKAAATHGSITAIGAEGDLKAARADTAQTEAELVGTRSAVERAEATKRALVEEKAARLAAAQEALLEAETHVPPAPSPTPSSSAIPRAAAAAPPPEIVRIDPVAPVGPLEPAANGPRIKVTPRGGADDSPRKTIGPDPGGITLRPTESAPAGASAPAKTLGPVEGEKRTAPVGEGDLSSSGSKRIGAVDPAPPAPAPAPAVVQVPKNADQLLDELERLGKLLEAGAISPEEFAAAKKKLL